MALGFGHVVCLGREASRAMKRMEGNLFAFVEYANRGSADAKFHHFTDKVVRNAVKAAIEFDMVVDACPLAFFHRAYSYGTEGKGRSAGRSSVSNSLRREAFWRCKGRSFICSRSCRIAVLRPPREKKVSWRKRAKIQRSTTWTATSALALSWGL